MSRTRKKKKNDEAIAHETFFEEGSSFDSERFSWFQHHLDVAQTKMTIGIAGAFIT